MAETVKTVGAARWSISGFDWKRILVGAGVALAGVLLTYGTEWISGTDFGSWTPVVVGMWSVIANIIRKWITDNSNVTTTVVTK